jgi:UDP-N-acetylglucosamine 2-epimerase
MKIISVVGARPQFIKLSALSKELRKNHTEIILHTGQHYDDELSRVFFSQLSIPRPDYNLGVGSAEHGEQTGRMLARIEEVLLFEKPHLVIVYGDTNSTLAGTLAAAKQQIPVAHVEAGLRSFVRSMPEEINRIVADHLSWLLFCPTSTAVRNLKREGITQGVHLVGDVMYDSFKNNLSLAERKSTINKKLRLRKKQFYLLTLHRAENTDAEENLKKVVRILTGLDRKVVFPIHPRTRKRLSQLGLMGNLASAENIVLLEPVSYLDMLILERNARFILTDSGGVQKEAFYLRTPCLTLRNETEWVETLKGGSNRLVGLDLDKIAKLTRRKSPTFAGRRGTSTLTAEGAGRRMTKIISDFSKKR